MLAEYARGRWSEVKSYELKASETSNRGISSEKESIDADRLDAGGCMYRINRNCSLLYPC
jgi:hypothetical protein